MRKSSLKLAAVEISMLVLALNLQDLTADSKSKAPDPAPKAAIMEYRTEQKSQEVYLAEPEAESLVASRDWDAEESYMLMKIAMAEAEGEDTEGKALVMMVVLNRVWSDGFPDSIEEVIFQDGQFSPVREGGRYYTTEPDVDCREALELVMNGWDESQGALYFESCGRESWHSRNLEFLFQHGNHKFYR